MSVDLDRVKASPFVLLSSPVTAPRAVLLSVRQTEPIFESASILLFSRLNAKRLRSDEALELMEPVLIDRVREFIEPVAGVEWPLDGPSIHTLA